MTIKWRCLACGAVHDGQTALTIMLSKSFVPVDVKEPKEEPKATAKPKMREEPQRSYAPKKAVEEEEYAEEEDLTLPED